MLSFLHQKAKLESANKTFIQYDAVSHALALAGLVEYIEEFRHATEVAAIFKLSDLAKLYTARLENLGLTSAGRIHTTRLKERILARIPDLKAYVEGRDTLITFEKNVGLALKKATRDDLDDDAMYLVKVAKIVRKEMQEIKTKFDGTFTPKCQNQAVPDFLIAVVAMIFDGPSIVDQNNVSGISQPALTIAQLMKFNFHRRGSKKHTSAYHPKDQETPLPIFLGLEVHAQTWKRELVETLHELGLSISYDRVLSISTDLANSVCQQYAVDGVVCPLQMRSGLYTCAEIDNINHNPSSSTAQGSFHGTGISLFQYPTSDFPGISRESLTLGSMENGSTTIAPLLYSYTNVTPILLKDRNPPVPGETPALSTEEEVIKHATSEEYSWLESVHTTIYAESLPDNCFISWSAYHAHLQPYPTWQSCLTSLLPLFQEDSKSVAMIRHAMDVIWSAVQHINPGQVPVFIVDQPLYVLAKLIQWNWPEPHGEDTFVVMLGGTPYRDGFFEVCRRLVTGEWVD